MTNNVQVTVMETSKAPFRCIAEAMNNGGNFVWQGTPHKLSVSNIKEVRNIMNERLAKAKEKGYRRSIYGATNLVEALKGNGWKAKVAVLHADIISGSNKTATKKKAPAKKAAAKSKKSTKSVGVEERMDKLEAMMGQILAKLSAETA